MDCPGDTSPATFNGAQFLADCDYELVPDPNPQEVSRNAGLVRDPKDIPIALSAINAEVSYLVTNDKDLTAEDSSHENRA